MTQRTALKLPKAVFALGTVSFLTDLSSEMIYPLLPLFLTAVLGAGPIALGVVEGLAESIAAILKLLSGLWADRTAKRKPFILAGYTLSGLVRPLVAFAGSWLTVAAIRALDRVGKGLRSAPRDALIADVTDASLRGKAFGVHRAMDHAGAVCGPLLAAGLLAMDVSLRHVFLLAAIPAFLVVITILWGVSEPPKLPEPSKAAPIFQGLAEMPADFWKLLLAVLIFTLGNSSDAFLLLALSQAGLPASSIALLWSAHHAVKMFASYFGGAWSDRFGRKKLILYGWIVYSLVYAAFAFMDALLPLVLIFLIYGIYFGLTEGTERAWIADLAPSKLRGTAYGSYNAVLGIAALPASFIFGLLWNFFDQETAFLTGSALALLASALVSQIPESAHKVSKS